MEDYWGVSVFDCEEGHELFNDFIDDQDGFDIIDLEEYFNAVLEDKDDIDEQTGLEALFGAELILVCFDKAGPDSPFYKDQKFNTKDKVFKRLKKEIEGNLVKKAIKSLGLIMKDGRSELFIFWEESQDEDGDDYEDEDDFEEEDNDEHKEEKEHEENDFDNWIRYVKSLISKLQTLNLKRGPLPPYHTLIMVAKSPSLNCSFFYDEIFKKFITSLQEMSFIIEQNHVTFGFTHNSIENTCTDFEIEDWEKIIGGANYNKIRAAESAWFKLVCPDEETSNKHSITPLLLIQVQVKKTGSDYMLIMRIDFNELFIMLDFRPKLNQVLNTFIDYLGFSHVFYKQQAWGFYLNEQDDIIVNKLILKPCDEPIQNSDLFTIKTDWQDKLIPSKYIDVNNFLFQL